MDMPLSFQKPVRPRNVVLHVSIVYSTSAETGNYAIGLVHFYNKRGSPFFKRMFSLKVSHGTDLKPKLELVPRVKA